AAAASRHGKRHRPQLTGLAAEPAHEPACVVDSPRRHSCRPVRARSSSNRYLDRCADLDGNGVHSQCKTVRTHCLFTGPYYLTMIVPVLAVGLGVISLGLYAWIVLGVAIILGGKIIWWATERAWGKFS